MSFIKKRLKKMSDEEARQKFKDVEFEKNDAFALFVAAFLTFMPAAAVAAAIIYFLSYLLLFH